MSDVPPIGTQLGELSIGEVLIEYDGPRLFTCMNQLGQQYLAIFVDEDEFFEQYIYAPQSASRIRDLLSAKISIRDALVKPDGPHVWVVTRALESRDARIKSMPASEIPEEWLPASTLKLEAGTQESVASETNLAALSVEMRWVAGFDGVEEASATPLRVELKIESSGTQLWGSEDRGVLLDAPDVLSFLAQAWLYLNWEEGLPLGLTYATLREVREALDDRRSGAPITLRREYERAFDDFMFGHDLAQMSVAAPLPSIVIAKEGLYGWLLREDDATRTNLTELLSPLEALAGQLVEGLTGSDDPRATDAVQRWSSRSEIAIHEAAEIITGLSSDDLKFIEETSSELRRELISFGHRSRSDISGSELLAAARLSTGLGPAQIADIVDLIGPLNEAATPELDTLAERAASAAKLHVFAYDQGLEVARWLRSELGIALDARVDPEAMLLKFGVEVRDIAIRSARDVDALGVWGPRRGPCVLINRLGVHARGRAGRRATAAHELCHLLLDRRGALPLAEVLHGRGSTVVEARARAFAAEFLLPQQVAGEAYRRSPDRPTRVVKALSRRFGVSAEMAAWNIRNSGESIDDRGRSMLSRLVRRPWRF